MSIFAGTGSRRITFRNIATCFGLVFQSGCLVIYPRAENTHAHIPASGPRSLRGGGKMLIIIVLFVYLTNGFFFNLTGAQHLSGYPPKGIF